MFAKVAFGLAFIGFGLCTENLQTIEFWEYPFYIGSSFAVAINDVQCYTFPENWKDTASSLDPHNRCIKIFDGDDCTGNSTATSKAIRNMIFLPQFNNKIRSFKLCPRLLANKVFSDSLTATLHFYERENLNGPNHTAEVRRTECYTLPVGWRDKIVSLDSNGYCIRTYRYIECRGSFLQTTQVQNNLNYHDYAYAIRSVKLCPTQNITPAPTTTTTTLPTTNATQTYVINVPLNFNATTPKPTTIPVTTTTTGIPTLLPTIPPFTIFPSFYPSNIVSYLLNATNYYTYIYDPWDQIFDFKK